MNKLIMGILVLLLIPLVLAINGDCYDDGSISFDDLARLKEIIGGGNVSCINSMDMNNDSILNETDVYLLKDILNGTEIIEIDNDKDGFNSTSDCMDNDGSVNPNATEICGNSYDENCDGIVEECSSSSYNGNECDYENTIYVKGKRCKCVNGVQHCWHSSSESNSYNKCEPNMVCEEWDNCYEGLQTRLCKDTSNCEKDNLESQACEIEPIIAENKFTLKDYLISGFIIIMLIILAFLLRGIYKDKKRINKVIKNRTRRSKKTTQKK